MAAASPGPAATNMASSPTTFTSRAPGRATTSRTRCSKVATRASSSSVDSCWFSAVYPTRSANPTTADVVLASVGSVPQSE